MSHTVRCIILIIRIRYDLTVVLVWIMRGPCQNIGRGYPLVMGLPSAYSVKRLLNRCQWHCSGILSIVKDPQHFLCRIATPAT